MERMKIMESAPPKVTCYPSIEKLGKPSACEREGAETSLQEERGSRERIMGREGGDISAETSQCRGRRCTGQLPNSGQVFVSNSLKSEGWVELLLLER